MRLALALLVAAALALPASAAAEDLTIHSSLPFHGSLRPQSRDTVLGEQLALEQAASRAGAFSVRLLSLDDATAAPTGGHPSASPPTRAAP
jgi:hypothetical protein